MKVKLLVMRIDGSGSYGPGDVIEVSASEGERLISNKQAEVVKKPKKEAD